MSNQIIVSVGDSAAVLLSPQDLQSLGVQVGDAIEVCASQGQLLLRPMHDADRQRLLDASIDDVVERRRSAYQRLAE